jgi:NADH-quinone oxidoreductase subunit N
MISFVDIAALSPLIILLVGALLLLLIESFAEPFSKKYAALVTSATLLIALFAAFYAPSSQNALLTPWIRFDSLSRLFTIFFLLIGLGATLLAISFFQRLEATQGEYFFLLLSALFGLILIGASANFLTLFLGLETLSIALYVLVGYIKMWTLSHEASIKYFLIGSLGAAFLLYGVALIYGATGSTGFEGLLAAYKGLSRSSEQTLALSGIALVTLGLAFKAAIVPFHVWAPDVYEGAPTPVTAFMAVGTKVGAFAAFARLFLVELPRFDPHWNQAIALLAFPTLIYAAYVALRQTELRRFFAYSGISHAGFLLIPLAASTQDALAALLFYLVIYALATLGCFAALAFLDDKSSDITLSSLNGLFRRSPLLASLLALCLLTLAGIPPTIGFFAKFYLFKTAYEAGYYALLVVALLTTILSAYFYLRFVAAMFAEAPAKESPPAPSWPAALVGLVACASIIALSFYPAPLMSLLTP